MGVTQRLLLLTGIACISSISQASAAPDDPSTWLDNLYDRAAADLVAGRPLVIQVHVPLCDNQIIWCGNERLGDGESVDRNLYWATSGGFIGWMSRSGSAWTRVTYDRHSSGDQLATAIWKRRLRPGPTWRARGVTRPFDVFLVATAWRGRAIDRAMARFADDLYGSATDSFELDGGQVLRAGGGAHIIGYVGHNGWMDYPTFDWNRPVDRGGDSPVKGFIAIACITADYLGDAVPAPRRVPLIMTTSLMFAGAHAFEGAVSAFAEGGTYRAIRSAAARNHAAGQGKPQRRVIGMFTNPSDRRWNRRFSAR